ncbi:MAG TPA: response regulator transcription factor [Alphaproteobacteria bacterium]|nr:response regulator transcription factor [Alphaproteobacteria bacterium]
MMTSRHILLVDDDVALRQSLAEQLAPEFQTTQVGTGADALAAIADGPRFDAVLLDVGLPDVDGREVCRRMRGAGVGAPIIMLTAAITESDTIQGLESGANDYVTKPFRLGVLLARLRVHLRQHEASEDAVFALGPYSFQPAQKVLVEIDTKKRIRLTEKEVAILRFLYRAGEEPVSRERLLGEVWGYNAGVNTHTLETHIYRLRQKMERDPAKAAILVTVPGGYRLSI